MKYIIEGTIKELSFDENFFTIAGTEGYAIKQKKDGMEMKYNVLCPENMPSNSVSDTSYILSQDFKFFVGENKDLLLRSLSLGKRIRITIGDINTIFGNSGIDKQKISLTLLAQS